MTNGNVLHDNVGAVELISTHGTDKSVVNAARVSNGKAWSDSEFTDKDFKLLKFLHREGHGSPFEHNQLIFRITAPLFTHIHFLKHRAGVSINSESGRYIEITEKFYVPAIFRQQALTNRQASSDNPVAYQSVANKIYAESVAQAYSAYKSLLALGVSKEQARGTLPECIYTRFFFTCNLRSLIHFINLRDHEDAQWETRQYAAEMRRQAATIFPFTFKAITEVDNG